MSRLWACVFSALLEKQSSGEYVHLEVSAKWNLTPASPKVQSMKERMCEDRSWGMLGGKEDEDEWREEIVGRWMIFLRDTGIGEGINERVEHRKCIEEWAGRKEPSLESVILSVLYLLPWSHCWVVLTHALALRTTTYCINELNSFTCILYRCLGCRNFQGVWAHASLCTFRHWPAHFYDPLWSLHTRMLHICQR